MAIEIFIKQTVRAKSRLTLNLLLITAVISLFIVSLNLYQNSTENLQTVENAYTTIAALEIYGTVDSQGHLVSAGDPTSVGNHLLTVFGYDLSALINHSVVKSYDWRYRCAAYIPGETAIDAKSSDQMGSFLEAMGIYEPSAIALSAIRDQIRFTINIPTEITVPLKDISLRNDVSIGINVIESALGVQYPEATLIFSNAWSETKLQKYRKDLQTLNGSDAVSTLTLYPGVEYIMSCYFTNCYWNTDAETGKIIFNNFDGGVAITADLYSQLTGLQYTSRGETTEWINDEDWEGPFFLQRSETVAADNELTEYWGKMKESVQISAQSFPVTFTNDVEGIPAWHTGGMFLHDGRMITTEEYASGAKVCMISASMADYQGWNVGDTLELNLYPFDSYQDFEGTYTLYGPWYGKNNDGFFDKGTYTIVGIYEQMELSDIGDAAPEVFYQPWNTIYAPTASVQNLSPREKWPLQPSLLTIQLKNGTVADYLKDMETLGLTDDTDGEYTIKFYTNDQGYSKVEISLQEMNCNAKILLGLSAALLAVTMILTAFLFSRQHKHSAGILRMLGGSKKQAFTAILVCAAAVATAGGIVGTVLGGALTQSVGASIMGDVESTTVALATGANAGLTILTGAGCIALFLLLTAIFAATYIGKEPRQLLPEDKG